jgi:hypothetical protein
MSIQVRPKNAASHICYLWVDLNKTKTGTNYFFLQPSKETRHLCIVITSQSMSFFDRSKIVVKKFPWMF